MCLRRLRTLFWSERVHGTLVSRKDEAPQRRVHLLRAHLLRAHQDTESDDELLTVNLATGDTARLDT